MSLLPVQTGAFVRMICYYRDNDDEPDDSDDGGNELLSARAPNSEG